VPEYSWKGSPSGPEIAIIVVMNSSIAARRRTREQSALVYPSLSTTLETPMNYAVKGGCAVQEQGSTRNGSKQSERCERKYGAVVFRCNTFTRGM
jgi:hypothetical protein